MDNNELPSKVFLEKYEILKSQVRGKEDLSNHELDQFLEMTKIVTEIIIEDKREENAPIEKKMKRLAFFSRFKGNKEKHVKLVCKYLIKLKEKDINNFFVLDSFVRDNSNVKLTKKKKAYFCVKFLDFARKYEILTNKLTNKYLDKLDNDKSSFGEYTIIKDLMKEDERINNLVKKSLVNDKVLALLPKKEDNK